MMKKFFRFFASILSAVIFVLCLISFIIIAISAKNNTVASIFNHSLLSILTQSMEPDYKPGDLVVVKKVDVKELKVGDIISFYSTASDIEGKPNTHRIIKIEKINGEPVFTTKGDNNEIPDADGVKAENIIGKVVMKIPVLGKAVRFLQTTKAAYFLVIMLPILVIFIFEVRNVVVKYREVKLDDENENS